MECLAYGNSYANNLRKILTCHNLVHNTLCYSCPKLLAVLPCFYCKWCICAYSCNVFQIIMRKYYLRQLWWNSIVPTARESSGLTISPHLEQFPFPINICIQNLKKNYVKYIEGILMGSYQAGLQDLNGNHQHTFLGSLIMMNDWKSLLSLIFDNWAKKCVWKSFHPDVLKSEIIIK